MAYRILINQAETRWTFATYAEAYDFVWQAWSKNGGGNHACHLPYAISPTSTMLSLTKRSSLVTDCPTRRLAGTVRKCQKGGKR